MRRKIEIPRGRSPSDASRYHLDANLSYRNHGWKGAVRPVVLDDLRTTRRTHGDSPKPARANRHCRAILRLHGIGRKRCRTITPLAIATGLTLPRACWPAIATALKARWPKSVDRPILGPAVIELAAMPPELLRIPRWDGKLGVTWSRAAPSSLPTLARLVAWVRATSTIGAPLDQDSALPPCGDPGASQGHYAPSPQGAVPPPADHVEPPMATPSGGAPSPATDASHATGPLERALARSRARRTKPAP